MRGIGVVIAGMLAAGVARGAELRPSLNTMLQWEKDPANAGDEERDGDLHVDVGAGFDFVSDPGARASWSFGYRPTYQQYLDLQDLDSWQHRASGAFGYALTRGTQLSVKGDYSRSIRTNLGFSDTSTAVQPELEATDEQIDRGSLGLALSHTFSTRWSGATNVRYSFTDYGRENLSDFESASAGASVSYRTSARQSLGGGFSVRRQIVKQADLQTAGGTVSASSDQETRYASLYGRWSYRFSPSWSLELSAGPTVIDSDLEDASTDPRPFCLIPLVRGPGNQLAFANVDDLAPIEEGDIFAETGEAFLLGGGAAVACFEGDPAVEFRFSNPDDLGSQGRSQTVFADFGLVRAGERTRFSLSYSRSAGENFGARTSTISDVLASTLTWNISQESTLDFRASYAKQQQATEAALPGLVMVANNGRFPGLPRNAAIAGLRSEDGTGEIRVVEGDDFFDVATRVLSVRATRRLTRRLYGFVIANYLDQRNEGDLGDRSVIGDVTNYGFGVGLTYHFDPIRF